MNFPDLFTASETSSQQNQDAFYKARAIEFIALCLAATFGEAGNQGIWKVGPYLALLSFVVALVIRMRGVGDKAEKRWYDSRAAAESIKSSAWQYAVGGGAFRLSDTTSQTRYLSSLNDVLAALPELDIPASSQSSAITSEMSETRSSDQASRREKYIEERVKDQVRWYAANAVSNKVKAKFWRSFLIIIESAAVILGFLRIRGIFDVNWLGAFAAAAAGVAAWKQTKNYSLLSEVYSVTSHEVNLVRETLISPMGEEEWAEAVQRAESAFSREHTLWLTRKLGSKNR